MTKKEFRKKCKEEKSKSYKLELYGEIASTIGFIIVMLTIFLVKGLIDSIIGNVFGGIIALIGMILSIYGEILLNKEYKEYEKK